jgi:hypothetical protein
MESFKQHSEQLLKTRTLDNVPMRIPSVRPNIRIDVAKQSSDTEDNTFLRWMRLSDISIHVQVSLNKKTEYMKHGRIKQYRLAADTTRIELQADNMQPDNTRKDNELRYQDEDGNRAKHATETWEEDIGLNKM